MAATTATADRVLFVDKVAGDLRYRSLTALGAVAFKVKALSDGASVRTSWIQVAVTGDFEHALYGKFSITKRDLKTMLSNFKEGRHPVPPTKICMDYDHLSMDPPHAGDGKAAGWFADMELRATNTELWAQIEWTDDGAAAIEKGEYKFVSPSFTHHKQNAQGDDIGCAMLAAAITNHPFLQGMAELSLSDLARFAGTVARPRTVSLAEFSHGEKGARLQDALTANYSASLPCGCCGYCADCSYGCRYAYVVDVFDAYAVYRTRDGLFRMDYTIDTTTGEVTYDGAPVEVVTNYATLSPSVQEDITMSATATKTIKLTAADGKTVVEVPTDQIEGLQVVKDLRATVAASVPKTEHEATVKQLTDLTTKVGTMEASLDAEKLARRTEASKVEVGKLLSARKITSAQVAPLEALALSDRAAFDALVGTFVAPVGPQRDQENGSGDDTRPAADATEEVNRRIATLRAKDAAMSFETARNKVFGADRDLYDRYRTEGAAGVR